MCILIAKKSNVRKMTTQEIKNSASNNPNGFGISYVYKGDMYIHKTFNLDDIIKLNDYLPDDTPIIYHFRIATHGQINEKNCHPFIDKEQGIAFAHNGVLSIENDKQKDWTDSETAFRYIFLPLLKVMDINSNEFECAVNTIIGSSKFAFLQENGDITTFGNFISEDGLLFSNGTYAYDKTSWYLPTTKSTTCINDKWDDAWDDCYGYGYGHNDYDYDNCYDDMAQLLDVYRYTDMNGNFNISKEQKEEFIDEWNTWYGSDYPALSKKDFKDILNCIIEDLKVAV